MIIYIFIHRSYNGFFFIYCDSLFLFAYSIGGGGIILLLTLKYSAIIQIHKCFLINPGKSVKFCFITLLTSDMPNIFLKNPEFIS